LTAGSVLVFRSPSASATSTGEAGADVFRVPHGALHAELKAAIRRIRLTVTR
jgi:hypothetical protein